LIATNRAPRLVVISDLLGDWDDLLTAARLRIATRGEVVLVHVIATEELDPPDGAVLAVDPEVPETRRILDGALRSAYRERFTSWIDAVAEAARASGVRYIRAVTNEPAARVIRRIAGDSA